MRSASFFFIASLGASLATSCSAGSLPPTAEIVVRVDCDATFPAAPGDSAHPYLFDHLRIDLLDQGYPTGVYRDFPVDEGTFRNRQASFAVLADPGRTLTAQVRIYRNDRLVDGQAPSAVTLETRAQLPAVAADSVLRVAVTLHLADVSSIVGYPDPIAAVPDDGAPSVVGTAVSTKDCGGITHPGEVCVPGGAFLFGLPTNMAGDPRAVTVTGERVVRISPFFMDQTEVTATSYAGMISRLGAPNALAGCDFGVAQSKGQPVGCVSFAQARGYCQALGKDLPTEAQYEYVASGLGREWLYPWGDDSPSCADVVATDVWSGRPASCWNAVQPPGSGRRDHAVVDASIVDLAGNLAELMRADMTLMLGEGPLLDDPVGNGPLNVARGGSYQTALRDTRATQRAVGDAVSMQIGFRCVRSL